MHAPSEGKVSLTENINLHVCGGELDVLYTFPRDWIGFKFSCVEFGERFNISRLLLKNTMWQKIAFAHVELNILLILTYCLFVVFAPC